MEKLTILGTGCAMVTKCYNTCFTLSDGEEYFLVDTGGGNTILTNLEKADIEINKIHNVYISHSHNDHIVGIIWIVRAAATQMLKGKYDGNLNIYCHKSIIDIFKAICCPVLQKKFTDLFDSRILFNEIYDGGSTKIMGYDMTFFDIGSKKDLQYGFTTTLKSGKKLTFLGDEPYRELLYNYAVNADYLLHESYCLYSQRDRFKPYEKSHATVKDACENADKLGVKNIILYHTEDKNILGRKQLYTNEGSGYFKGNIIVPDDLDVINL
jgi:ribonuclease Z